MYESNLACLAAIHRNLKQYEQSVQEFEEAIELYRKLAETNPDVYLSELADYLTKYADMLYELEYVAGKIVRSRNYDSKGNINMEQTFYDNGQVHYRNEFTKSGKKTTEFDVNGKIK